MKNGSLARFLLTPEGSPAENEDMEKRTNWKTCSYFRVQGEKRVLNGVEQRHRERRLYPVVPHQQWNVFKRGCSCLQKIKRLYNTYDSARVSISPSSFRAIDAFSCRR